MSRVAGAGPGGGAVRPKALVFDVNETLSDMAPLAQRFTDVGAPGHLSATWFASLLRDGFALTAVGVNPRFADLGRTLLAARLRGQVEDVEGAVEHVMTGFGGLSTHPDVVPGIRRLAGLRIRLLTLSNGSATVAEGLLSRAGIRDSFEALLSVEDAPLWKPAPSAYAYAVETAALTPAECMLVAVHPWDIDGAHRAGLRTAWVNRGGGRYPDHFSSADLEVASMTELAAQLARLDGLDAVGD
ncbi:haloacid dehalogenase type II [Nostocoides sp. F2B08]|uniref:haloacid dehalogenase type II n=1 Tax=Nostocoides sp. F2B08 TaxID=2653936 RepID=UPI001262DC30|nr:haloacid dehalogenase type II [Tetrasphaera sp. F2B08]KAB7745598.1 haloacid dehalogenase type II [Tetrasphaera sp. F2B08]